MRTGLLSRTVLLACWLLAPAVATAEVDTASLDIGLVVFDAGIPEDPTHNRDLGIFPKIREAEARYLPFALRRTLVESDRWGPVRVLPDPTPGTELLVTGRILESNGITLEIAVRAVDSRGIVWVDKTYRESSSEDDYLAREANLERPFQELYDRVAADIAAAAAELTAVDIGRINELSLLRYAAALAPAAFGDYYRQTEEGLFELLRLPAADDPMLARIQRVREQEYIFIDTMDEQYAKLFSGMGPTYDLWRQYNREQALYEDAREDALAGRSKPRRGSYQAMKQTYNNYRWSKIQEQESARLAKGFNNEVQPTIMHLQGRVIELEGSLEDQYREWRRILHSIYELETGVAG